jgi:arylsulfatase
MKSRPPIHLLFSSDRGLRDGEWKLDSFQSQPWELYHMPTDRTELNNVATQNPEILQRMIQQWHDMSRDVLRATPKEQAPLKDQATAHQHREWTNYDADPKTKAAKPRKAKADSSDLPRARVGTKLQVLGQQFILECTGEDPGLAFDKLPTQTVKGPYSLRFRLKSQSSGPGELYWTNDPKTLLPRGQHLDFPVAHDDQWHDYNLTLQEPAFLHNFRLDPCAGPGRVLLDDLQLLGQDGSVLAQWPR